MDNRRLYYQGLADIIRIVWEGHKQSIEKGETSFGVVSKQGSGKYEPYNFVRALQSYTEEFGDVPYNPVPDFGTAIGTSLQRTWRALITHTKGKQLEPELTHITTFNTPYLKELLSCVETQAPNASASPDAKETRGNMIVYASISGGAATQGDYAAYSVASKELAQAGLTPSQANLAFAKLRLGTEDFDKLSELLCVGDLHKNVETVKEVITPEGLNMETLEKLGFAKTLGCPARMQATSCTWTYLQENHGVLQSKHVVIDEFTRMTSDYFRKQVVPHIKTSAAALQPAFIADMKVVAQTRCPYRKQ
jgi:hypothetical protein